MTSRSSQTMKSSPRPLASQKSRKTHCGGVKNHFCDLMKKQISNLVDKRYVCDVRVTSRPFFTLIHEMNIRCLLLRGRSHEQGMRPWNVVVET